MSSIILSGTVISGLKKGKQLGFPTFNMKISDKYSLEDLKGVWCSYTFLKKEKMPSVTHIGPVKIFGQKDIRVETHILDYNEDIYGENVRVELLHKLRQTQNFTSQNKLINQIKEDINQTKKYFQNI